MRIAFIGLGSMGRPMARNLIAADHDVVVWNRTEEKAEALEGAPVAGSPAEAARDADLVVTMLSDDAAVEAVTFGEDGVLVGLGEGGLHACMTTISVGMSRRLAAAHDERGQRYVAGPVFGRPDAAESASLWIVAGGEASDIDACRPAFDALGQGVIVAGAEPEQANVMKLAGNFMLASAIEAMAEAYTLVRAHGIDAGLFHETMADRLFRSPIYQNYGGMIEAQEYEPAGFQLAHGLKDIRYGLEAAGEAHVPMPVASAIRDRFLTAAARGWLGIDWAGLGRVAADLSG